MLQIRVSSLLKKTLRCIPKTHPNAYSCFLKQGWDFLGQYDHSLSERKAKILSFREGTWAARAALGCVTVLRLWYHHCPLSPFHAELQLWYKIVPYFCVPQAHTRSRCSHTGTAPLLLVGLLTSSHPHQRIRRGCCQSISLKQSFTNNTSFQMLFIARNGTTISIIIPSSSLFCCWADPCLLTVLLKLASLHSVEALSQ